MRRSLQYRICLLLVGLAPIFFCQAQQIFLYKAVLPDVKTPGFHRVALQPGITSRCREDLGDIRIFDNNNQQVPYIVRWPNASGAQYIQLPSPVVYQADSVNKSSYITVRMNDEYYLDKLELDLQGPRFYKRSVTIKKGPLKSAYFIKSFSIQSGTKAVIPVSFKAKQFTITIENEDNPPLIVRAVSAWQLNKSLLAYLDPGKNYQLAFGNSKATLPSYDLEFFKDSIGNVTDTLVPGPVEKNTMASDVINETEKNGNDLALWIIIAIVLVLLLVLTLRLTREVNGKETH